MKFTTASFLLFFYVTISGLASCIQDSDVILLSYPRSGNTWTRYCIEYLTKRPTLYPTFDDPIRITEKDINAPLSNLASLGVDLKKNKVFKHHLFFPIDNKNAYLILLLRNYKECLKRHSGSFSNLLTHIKWYFDIIKVYHNWPKEKRLLIYYEDLIASPKETLLLLTSFFNEGEDFMDTFICDYEYHKQRCIQIYDKSQGSVTKGNFIIYHSKNIDAATKKKIDLELFNVNSTLFSLYLSRYKEP